MIHLLTHPFDSPVNGAVCGVARFTAATAQPELVTCPVCLRGRRTRQAGGVPEKQWLQQVLTLARSRGYMAYHPHHSQKSAPGWPDVALAKAGSPLYLVELKTNLGRLSGPQRHWLETLRQTTGTVVAVWRPDDFPLILEVLR